MVLVLDLISGSDSLWLSTVPVLASGSGCGCLCIALCACDSLSIPFSRTLSCVRVRQMPTTESAREVMALRASAIPPRRRLGG